MPMTEDAKSALSNTIHHLRKHLLRQLRKQTISLYQLHIENIEIANLPEELRRKRVRLENWIEAQIQSKKKSETESAALKEYFLMEIVKKAVYKTLNRHIYIRLLEGFGICIKNEVCPSRQNIDSPIEPFGYVHQNDALAFDIIFDDLQKELPGLFKRDGIDGLIPLPSSAFQKLMEELHKPELETCWTDDMTLGWVYQFWNDPEKARIDAKINNGGKLENHEIASKTQLFTERYMVDWILQNTLGSKWLAICAKNGWIADVVSTRTLEQLEKKRDTWKHKREMEEVTYMDLMPTDTELERQWLYYVVQPLSKNDIQIVPSSIRDFKIMDPACGTGHFLVIAMELLFSLYKEEARHRQEMEQPQWSDKAIVERILSHNIYGLDIDPLAIQIAAVALMLKAKILNAEIQPTQINLVASALNLGHLQNDDPAILEFVSKVKAEIGIEETFIHSIISNIKNADHLGTLLKIHREIDEIIARKTHSLTTPQQVPLQTFEEQYVVEQRNLDPIKAKKILLYHLTKFLNNHTHCDDLGLQLHGHQKTAGLRFLEINQENTYDVVVGNPPYQGTGKMRERSYLEKHYSVGKSDLYACFLIRGLELGKIGGFSCLLTMRGWMFISSFTKLRQQLLENHCLLKIGDVHSGAFSFAKGGVVITTVISLFQRKSQESTTLIVRPKPMSDISGNGIMERTWAGLQCQAETFSVDLQKRKSIEGWPLMYWWDDDFVQRYLDTEKIGNVCPPTYGVNTGDNTRFLRFPFECRAHSSWVPFIKGASGKKWIEPLSHVIDWKMNALSLHMRVVHKFGDAAIQWKICGKQDFFSIGVAFSSIGTSFSARIHRNAGVIGNAGASIYHKRNSDILCLLNSKQIATIAESFNPTVNFTPMDVNRLPLFTIADADKIYNQLEIVFGEHESHREPSVEFKHPGPSCWNDVQNWAQQAVDRAPNTPLSKYNPVYEIEPPTDHISYALGIVLGRFKVDGTGIIDPITDDVSDAIPHGILFLNGSLLDSDLDGDSLGHEVSSILHETWNQYGNQINKKKTIYLRDYLRERFFEDVHLDMYEGKPIYWPLSSNKKTFVAWVNIHRMDAKTLERLEMLYLKPAEDVLKEHVSTLCRQIPVITDLKEKQEYHNAYTKAIEQLVEIQDFCALIHDCSTKGPPPTESDCPPRERDARYIPELDDGVMINAAALWPLLEPQWKMGSQTPKKWWRNLCLAKGKKDCDWSYLAMKYWPTRVDKKCQEDPSLSVSHGCIWKYHPELAWTWELRLQYEIGFDFVIEETDHDNHRLRYFSEDTDSAIEILYKEVVRREKQTSGMNEIVLNRSGLWSVAGKKMLDMEKALAKKLFHLRTKENITNYEEVFTIQAPDRAKQLQMIIGEKKHIRFE